MDRLTKLIGLVVLSVGAFAVLAAIGAYPTKWVANWLFTSGTLISLFGVAKISFWQAFWLNYLCASLFKGAAVTSK